MSIQIIIDSSGVDSLLAKFKGYPAERAAFLDQAGIFIEDTLRSKMPVKTGWLVNSITKQQRGRAEGVKVTVIAPYAMYVDQGTRPHMIFPRYAKALKFEVAGQTIFAKYVNHPGTTGYHFIEKTVEEAGPKLVDMALERLMRLLS